MSTTVCKPGPVPLCAQLSRLATRAGILVFGVSWVLAPGMEVTSRSMFVKVRVISFCVISRGVNGESPVRMRTMQTINRREFRGQTGRILPSSPPPSPQWEPNPLFPRGFGLHRRCDLFVRGRGWGEEDIHSY